MSLRFIISSIHTTVVALFVICTTKCTITRMFLFLFIYLWPNFGECSFFQVAVDDAPKQCRDLLATTDEQWGIMLHAGVIRCASRIFPRMGEWALSCFGQAPNWPANRYSNLLLYIMR